MNELYDFLVVWLHVLLNKQLLSNNIYLLDIHAVHTVNLFSWYTVRICDRRDIFIKLENEITPRLISCLFFAILKFLNCDCIIKDK